MNIEELRITAERINKVCRQLEACGEDINHSSLVLTVLEKLPEAVIIEVSKGKDCDAISMDELGHELEIYIQSREKAQDIRACYDASRTRHQGRPKIVNTVNFPYRGDKTVREHSQKGATICIFCSKMHHTNECQEFPLYASRVQRIRELHLYYRCLRMSHQSNACQYNRPCFYCGGNHHRALCRRKEANKFTGTLGEKGSAAERQQLKFEGNQKQNDPNLRKVQGTSSREYNPTAKVFTPRGTTTRPVNFVVDETLQRDSAEEAVNLVTDKILNIEKTTLLHQENNEEKIGEG
ncbi:hypothetical protein AB6A40_010615 [Gnathostoma spinigerum]|uniref:Gag-like protein n=1 Tax=Gnathostoma spinigerum TaxID=75299 RepID=A0ABD6F1H1_9BILA